MSVQSSGKVTPVQIDGEISNFNRKNEKSLSQTSHREEIAHSTPKKFAVSPEETEKLQELDHEQTSVSGDNQHHGCHKYYNALKVLLPFRPAPKDKSKLPSNKAGLISFFSLTWLTKLMWKAYKEGLQKTDLWDLQEEDSAAVSWARIHKLWEEEKSRANKSGNPPRLWNATWKAARTRILASMFVSLIMNIFQFIGPSILLKLTLDYINDTEINTMYAVYLVLAVLLANMLRVATFNIMTIMGIHTATRVTGGIQALIYRKILKLKTGGEKLSAQITNIIANDMERLFEACFSSVFLTASPALFLLSAVYGVIVIGPWALFGMGVYLLFYPVMGLIAKAQSRVRVKTVKVTDKRVGLMSEILNSLKLIKMYSWEDSFADKISAIRRVELQRHILGSLLHAVSSTTVPSISILATICTLLGYTLTGLPLGSSEAFTIYSIFNAMQFTMGVLPFTVRSIAEARVSLARIQKLLSLPEHRKDSAGLVNNNLAINVKNATFAWEIHSIDLSSRPATAKENDEKCKKGSKENGVASDKECINGNVINEEEAFIPSQNETVVVQRSHHPPTKESLSSTQSPIHGINSTIPNLNSPTKSTKSDMSPFHSNITISKDCMVEITETLFGVNLSVEKGKLVGICGSIGSGKSSLVSAICGDMKLGSGQLQVNGRLALVSQQAWIYNASFRENILVGLPYEEEKYKRVIDVCSLQTDIDLLANGDLTEIGERGINLSGGQKQRVNLARAVYSNRDIYLLDDPLSAVDTKVGKHLFNNCILNELKEKTVILVTHSVHFLEKCEEVVLMKYGRICERGHHKTLMEREGAYFEMMGGDSNRPNQNTTDAHPDSLSLKNISDKNAEPLSDGKLIKEETKQVGSVSGKVYLTFIKVCGGWCICMLIFFAVIVFTLARIFNIILLQQWLDAGDGLQEERKLNATNFNLSYTEEELIGDIIKHPNLWIFQLVYGLSFVVMMITGIIKGVGVSVRVLAGSSRLHQDMFDSILRSPMKFLDVTPAGRILNRFSRDMDEVDIRVPFFLEFVLQGVLAVFGQIIMVCVIFPYFALPLLVVTALFVWADVFLNAGVRELKRLDNNLKSPVLQHIATSISGLSVIRTFDRENEFIDRFHTYLDKHSVALLVFRLSNRWFTCRMDFMATVITVAITALCVFTKGQFSTAMAGLALSTIYGVCGFIPFLMRMKSELTSRLTSVERIMEYAYELESEAPREIEATKPPPSWPSVGEIQMHEMKLRYRPELPLVLHGISASISGSEKIGIVGRTGAGKSSLMSCFLRLVELDSGFIKIDGVDISKIGLHTLRTAVSVIPQDPVLFQGSVRYNLDPFNEYSDEAVWMALERSHLKKAIQKLPQKLLSEVEAAGENFSVGEKQLLCLARALLRSSQILLLDEATASVDVETDLLIQETIKESFRECTVLTIAHRLNTVTSYDRVMVLDAGIVLEFDSPENLMLRESSVFREMMEAMGVYTVGQMKALSQ